jgi:hypothetical protein
METKKQKALKQKIQWIGIGLIILVIILTFATYTGKLEATIENNHLVPRDYIGVYRGINDDSIVIVLNGADETQSRMAYEVERYLAYIK